MDADTKNTITTASKLYSLPVNGSDSDTDYDVIIMRLRSLCGSQQKAEVTSWGVFNRWLTSKI